MWGFAEVEASEADGAEIGTRVYGYLPPSSSLIVEPVAADGGSFVDGSAHRKQLPSAYHRYLATGSDPFYRAETEAVQMLLRPLFFTSFLLDDLLADDGLHRPRPDRDLERLEQDLARGGVSAEPARRRRSRRAHLSPQRGFRRRTRHLRPSGGLRDDRVARDRPRDLRRRLRRRRPAGGGPLPLRRRAGGEHRRRRDPLGGARCRTPASSPARRRPSSSPPIASQSATEDWGREVLEERVAAAWHPFCEWMEEWLEMIPGTGFEAVQSAFLDVLEGRVDPKHAHVLSLR